MLHIIMLYMFLLCFLVSLPTRLPPQDLSLLSWFHCLQGFNSRTCFCCQEHQFSGLTVSDTRSINSLALLLLIPRESTLWPYTCSTCEAPTPGLNIQRSCIPHATHLISCFFTIFNHHMLLHMQLISSHAFSQSFINTCYHTCHSSPRMLFSQSFINTFYHTCNSSHLMPFTIFHQHMLSHMQLISYQFTCSQT
jgi:hypothetical protein